jgi:F-type H+-transporting ATPase subunit delta|tara:strand:- start:15 stop:572 length:558 start_codon:yes stop_codon:yes gene_type:complete
VTSLLSSGDLISDRYASALYDLAAEKKIVDLVLEDLAFLQKCTQENKDLKLLAKSPLITSSDKLNIFEKILSKRKTDNLTNTFLKVISRNKRFAKLSSIISQFMNINSQKRGDVLADVTSADELSDNQKNGIRDQLKQTLGKKLSLNFNVDKKIIGGLIVKVGSKMVDSSLVTKINKLKIAMREA